MQQSTAYVKINGRKIFSGGAKWVWFVGEVCGTEQKSNDRCKLVLAVTSLHGYLLDVVGRRAAKAVRCEQEQVTDVTLTFVASQPDKLHPPLNITSKKPKFNFTVFIYPYHRPRLHPLHAIRLHPLHTYYIYTHYICTHCTHCV